MPLVIDTDPFSPTCNSYADVAGADEYVSTRVPDSALSAAWAGLTSDQKSMYLVNATRSIDNYVEWIGDKYSRDQKLDWPRVNAYVDGFILDQITFPEEVVEATYEMALWAMANSGAVSVDQNSSYDMIKVGPITIDFNQQALGSARQYFPDIVSALLKDLGSIQNPDRPGANMLKLGKLQRA